MIRSLVALSLLAVAVSAGYTGVAPYSAYNYAAPSYGGYGYAVSPYSYGASPYAYSSPYYGHSSYPYATSYANTYKYAYKTPYAYSGYHAPAYGGYSPYSYGAYPYYGSYGGYIFLNAIVFVYSKPLVPVPLEPSNIVLAEPSLGIAHIPAHVGTAISKTIQYAETPAITGYASTLYKPDLSPFGAGSVPYHYTYQDTLLRPTKILIPKIAKIEPDVVNVPVIQAIKDIEIASPILPKIPAINHDLIQYAPIVPPL